MDTRVSIKAQTDETVTVAGWLVVYGGADLAGETFTADTDFWLERLGKSKPVLYDHGFNDAVKRAVLGTGTITAKEDGLWFEAELEKHNRYVQQVMRLIEADVMGWSSGAVAHLVEVDDGGQIKSWPIAEGSLTVTPAEPRTLGVEQIRSLVAHVEALKGLLPEGEATASPAAVEQTTEATAAERVDPTADAAASLTAPVVTSIRTLDDGENSMADEQTNDLAAQVAALKSGQDALSDLMNKITKFMEDAPSIKNAGYVTQDGGAADPEIKSFGDFCLAVKRGDVKRLTTVYKSVKDLVENTGSQGGYLVPNEFHARLLQIADQDSAILSRIPRQPVMTDAGTFPALDQFAAPTAGAGNTAYAAGITAATTAEGAALTETNAAFAELNYRINKIGGYVEVSNELVADSPFAIEALLSRLFAIAVRAKLERNVLRGSGVGEPLGILNSAAAIGVTTATNNAFAWTDALAMRARFKSVGGSPVWIIHPGVYPDLGVMESTGGGSVWQANMAAGSPSTLLGYPVLESEHMPQDDNDDVILADLSAYIIFDRQQLSIAFSEHAAFLNDKGTWRFTMRVDGQPWVKNVITLPDPQGSYTVSPFVYHDD
jgi:HK97 family phage major capsid protein